MDMKVFYQVMTLACILSVSVAKLSQYQFNHVNIIDDSLLMEYKKSPEITVVYYYKTDVPRLSGFFKQLDKSAEFLELYGVKAGVYDCNKEVKAEICEEGGVDRKFFTYSNDRELIQLDLETMFDLNSIMSNILQLVLLREVPILQSKDERLDYEEKYKGKYDIIFGYQKAIGTFEHRIFMEVAYAYQDKFRFAISTAKASTEGLEDSHKLKDVAIWVLHCKGVKSRAEPCTHSLYVEAMDLVTLAGYVRGLTLPSIFNVPADGKDIPYHKDGGMHTVYLFYGKDNKRDVMEKAAIVSDSFKGIIGVVTVDSESDFKVDGFDGKTPSVAMYRKNQKSATFMTDDFTTMNVYTFVYNQIETAKEEREESKPGKDKKVEEEEVVVDDTAVDVVEEEQPEMNPEDVEEQDDQVADAVHRARFKSEMNIDIVPHLTDKTFPKTVQVKNLLFVLFYLPFDHKSMAFLRAYVDASKQLENDTDQPLARVDCHDWTDVCGKEKVIMYPTVKVYQKGKILMNYDGLLDTDEVVKTVKLLKHASHTELKGVQEINNFINGVFPDGEIMPSNTALLALFDKSHKKEMKVLEEVASELKSKLAFGVSSNGQGKDIAKKQFGTGLPAIILLKRADNLQPTAVYNGHFDNMEILQFVSEAGLPKMAELTVQLFPSLYAQKKPFVIAFLDGLEESKIARAELEQVVKANKFPDVSFCWLPLTSNTGFGRKILDAYNKSASAPAISHVNLRMGKVYNFVEKNLNEGTISDWLNQIQEGHLEPSTVLPKGDWKPLKEGYNFLAMMDWEAKQKQKKKGMKEEKEGDKEDATAEEFGLGFDKEGNEVNYDNEVGSLEDDNGETDAEIRAELLQLRNSRLYHQHDKSRKVHAQHEAELNKEKEKSSEMDGNKNQKNMKKQSKHEEL